MTILLLFGAQFLLSSVSTLLIKNFQLGLKLDGANLLYYNLLNALFATFNFWAATGFRAQMNGITLLFSFVYALVVIYCMCQCVIALKYMTIPMQSVLASAGSLITSAVCGALLFDEGLGLRRCIAIVLVLAAVVLPWVRQLKSSQRMTPVGALMYALTFLTGGVASIICKLYAVTPGVLESNQFFLMTNVVIAVLCAAALAFHCLKNRLPLGQLLRFFRFGQVANIAANGLLSNISAVVSMVLLAAIPLVTYNIASACVSMLACVSLSTLVFREKVTPVQLISAALVLAGTAINAL